jgi:hypothetical protein
MGRGLGHVLSPTKCEGGISSTEHSYLLADSTLNLAFSPGRRDESGTPASTPTKISPLRFASVEKWE